MAFFEGHRDFITRNMAPLGQALDRDLSGYIDGYYLEILQHFEQTGQVTGPDQHIDNFMKWVNENGQD